MTETPTRVQSHPKQVRHRFKAMLRAEHTGAVLLLLGALVALVWANSPWHAVYETVSSTVIGPVVLHLDLTVAQWATDGLLAIFFFVVGLELKREIMTGQLRNIATAVVPIVAAVGGMLVPALVYLLLNAGSADGASRGWAIPVATDIAFALAVLAVFGRGLPIALRTFILTLAIVDDLLGIVIIAVFYAGGLSLWSLLASLAVVAVFALVVRRGAPPWFLVVLGLAAWGLMHASGVHATISGVLLGLVVPALPERGETMSLVERFEVRWTPVAAYFAVPLFALFAAGVTLDADAVSAGLRDPVAHGVALGLLLGKPAGILLMTFLLVRFTRANLHDSIRWLDLAAVAVVGGIGFTVSLLVAHLSFPEGSGHSEAARAAVLVGSLAAAVCGGLLLSWRSRAARGRAAAT